MEDDLLRRFEEFVPRYVAYVKRGVSNLDLTPMRLSALGAIASSGDESPEGVTMGQVARALGVTPYGVTKIVDGLEADGLVERFAHPSDRRAKVLRLTDDGCSVLYKGGAHHHDNMARMLAVLNDDERTVVANALKKMSEFVDRQDGG